MNRRDFVTAILLGVAAGHAAAQSCSVNGPSLDEILAGWHPPGGGKSSDDYFDIEIQRKEKAEFTGLKDNQSMTATGVAGQLRVNGELLGDVLENDALKIPAGTYRGRMRYVSGKGFVQGPFNVMADKGDFLLEVAGVSHKTDILIHQGNKPWHSTGCILAGPITRKFVDGRKFVSIDSDATLSKLRRRFYGTDLPTSCPNKRITITIRDI